MATNNNNTAATPSKVITAQTGGREFDKDLTKYSLFVGGVNATHHALENYSPLMNGFGRLFMVRPPKAIQHMFAPGDDVYGPSNLFNQFKHILEYMNRSVTGFQDKTLEAAGTSIMGGFAGRSFNTPTVTKEMTTQVTISVFELNGSPVYTVVDGWMNAIGDENSGLATYGGLISGGKGTDGHHKRLYGTGAENELAYEFNEAYHTAEFIYVLHDRSGAQVERAVLLAGAYPTAIQQNNVLDMTAGQHDNVTYDIGFNCTVYRSPIITAIANDLLKQYRIVSNSLNFNPELGDAVYSDNNTATFSQALGRVPFDSATGTSVGNMPVYDATPTPTTSPYAAGDMTKAKLAGQNVGGDAENAMGWNGTDRNTGNQVLGTENVGV